MAGVFVEVGSCDFDNYDILLLDGWTGYFVEPVPEYLNSLYNRINNLSIERNKKLSCIFTKGAISNFTGEGEIRYIPPENNEWWVKGLGHVLGKKNNGIESRSYLINKAVTIKSQFYTLDDYFYLHSIKEVDILKIDVEGHEIEVLENYSWKIKPRHIKIEHTFVGLQNVLDILNCQGYNCFFDDEDVFGTYKG